MTLDINPLARTYESEPKKEKDPLKMMIHADKPWGTQTHALQC